MIEILSDQRFHVLKHAVNLTKIEQYFSVFLEEEQSVKYFIEVDSLLEELYYWYRDLHLLSVGASVDYIFHLDSLNILQQQVSRKVLPLEKIGELIEESRLAAHRSIKIKTVLEYLFSQLCP